MTKYGTPKADMQLFWGIVEKLQVSKSNKDNKKIRKIIDKLPPSDIQSFWVCFDIFVNNLVHALQANQITFEKEMELTLCSYVVATGQSNYTEVLDNTLLIFDYQTEAFKFQDIRKEYV
jgi:hypothetical protein